MKKKRIVQRFMARLRDGRVVDVCCGPAVAKLDLVGYWPVGDAKAGVCCHS